MDPLTTAVMWAALSVIALLGLVASIVLNVVLYLQVRELRERLSFRNARVSGVREVPE